MGGNGERTLCTHIGLRGSSSRRSLVWVYTWCFLSTSGRIPQDILVGQGWQVTPSPVSPDVGIAIRCAQLTQRFPGALTVPMWSGIHTLCCCMNLSGYRALLGDGAGPCCLLSFPRLWMGPRTLPAAPPIAPP